MTVYWEASRKPLFVKTIWADGHHHAVLTKNDPLCAQDKRHRKNKSVLRVENRKNIEKTSDDNNDTLSINTVRILPTDEKTPINEKSPRFEHQRTFTIDVIPSDSVRFKDINKEVVFSNKLLHPNPITAFRIPLRSETAVNNEIKLSNQIVKENQCESLSERVMVWLDLAAQNGQNYEFHKEELSQKRITTAHILQENKITKEICFNYEKTFEKPKTIVINASDEDFCEKPKVKINWQRELIEDTQDNNLSDLNPFQHDAKRQLHIFMPNIPNKKSDCDSVLTISSKSSLKFECN